MQKFWAWYERNFLLNLTISTLLFALQLFHLYWLFTDVILVRLTGSSYFVFPPFWGFISTFLDYSEIPAIVSTTILYLHLLRKEWSYKNLWLMIFLNIQWLHILWITDEVVVERFNSELSLFTWAIWLSWFAILIDYLELPVIWDTARRLIKEIKEKRKTA